jgi:uncharacterized protein with PIN domain
MVTEFDLPCSNCGGQLEQIQTPKNDQVEKSDEDLPLAECVDCGAHYYPDSTLRQM